MAPRKPRPKADVHPNALTERELRFVEQLLAGANKGDAARAAGYSARSAHVTASQLLKKPKIQAALRAARDRRAIRTAITQDRVLFELEHLAFSNFDHYRQENGRIVLAEGAPPDAMRAISKVKFKETTREMGKSTITEREVEIALWDKPSMVKLAGKHVGLAGFYDRVELTGKNGKPLYPNASELTDEELERELEAALATVREKRA